MLGVPALASAWACVIRAQVTPGGSAGCATAVAAVNRHAKMIEIVQRRFMMSFPAAPNRYSSIVSLTRDIGPVENPPFEADCGVVSPSSGCQLGVEHLQCARGFAEVTLPSRPCAKAAQSP